MNIEDSFLNKVVETENCWNWAACITKGGYGLFWNGSKLVLAHRYSYQKYVGEIPTGLVLDHLCRNRKCVNPKHLEAITTGENSRRGMGFTFKARKTHCKRGHEYTEANTYIIDTAKGWKQCRRCAAVTRRNWYVKNVNSFSTRTFIRERQTHCRVGHEYTEANTYVIKRTNGWKQCKQCSRIYQINWRQRRRLAIKT